MWSAIPIALLFMIVNLSEGKHGSGPKGVKVLYYANNKAGYTAGQSRTVGQE